MTEIKKKRGPKKGVSNNPGGRPKGVPNKLTADLRAMILAALDRAGGENYLYEQALENPKAFLALLSRVLPMTVAGDSNAPLTIKIVKGLGD